MLRAETFWGFSDFLTDGAEDDGQYQHLPRSANMKTN
jgi:hypothetical protein